VTGPTPPAPPDPAAPAPPEGDAAELRTALDAERSRVKDLEGQLARLAQQGMTGAERAVAEARAEGKAEAEQAAALRLAAAEFRAQAAGRLANPDAALAVLDLSKLVKDGEPDKAAIAATVDQLGAVPPAPGRVPPGPREPAAADTADWVRALARRH
jgi:hypothetical protein